jgi:DNA-binding MarR family transcriptional regulator
VRGERIKSPKVIGWIDLRSQKKPYRADDTNSARYRVAEYLKDHIGEWMTSGEIAAIVGRKSQNVEAILADLENDTSYIMLVFDEDRKRRNIMAVPRGRGDWERYFDE